MGAWSGAEDACRAALTAPCSSAARVVQDRIAAAGAGAVAIRLGGLALALLGTVMHLVHEEVNSGAGSFHGPDPAVVPLIIAASVLYVLFWGGIYGLAIAFPLAFVYRCVRRRQLRRQLAALPPAQQVKALTPYWGGEGDAGKIADRLAAELCLDRYRSELVPAGAPAGRGDEVTPAE